MIIEFWTLEINPITCYRASKENNKTFERMDLDTQSLNKISNENKSICRADHPKAVGVIVEDLFGQKIPFGTAIEAAEYLKIKPGSLYNILRGARKNNTNFKIYKS